MMGDVIRLVDPKRETSYASAASNAVETLYAGVAMPSGDVHIDDLTIALARTVYELFYRMHDGYGNPAAVCKEMEDFKVLMDENLPKLKENIWRGPEKEEA